MRSGRWASFTAAVILAAGAPTVNPPPASGEGATLRPIAELVEPSTPIESAMGSVVVDVAPHRATIAELERHRALAVTAAIQQADADRSHHGLRTRWSQRVEHRVRIQAQLDQIDAELALTQAQLGAYAVDSYLGGHGLRLAAGPFDPGRTGVPQLVHAVGDELLTRQHHGSARRDATADRLDVLTAELDSLEGRARELAAEREAAAAALAEAEMATARLQARLADDLWAMSVHGTDLPVVALEAYVGAALALALDDRACGVQWWQLAGIGRIETGHGTHGGHRLGGDGRTSGPILGPVLDGNGVAAIADSDDGRLDGDPVWDRAVGPMQFIPGTWARLGRDGDGNGAADPHDLHDAAYSAATLLCRAADHLDEASNYRRALLAYNRSSAYASSVMAHAKRYRDAVALAPPP